MKIRYNHPVHGVNEGEYQGVTFRYTNEAIIDALHFQHIDLLRYIERAIETLARNHEHNFGTSPDFSIRVKIMREVEEAEGNLTEIGHNIRVIKIPRLKDEE